MLTVEYQTNIVFSLVCNLINILKLILLSDFVLDFFIGKLFRRGADYDNGGDNSELVRNFI